MIGAKILGGGLKTLVGIGIGGVIPLKMATNALEKGTAFTNPLIPDRGAPRGYGKRGIDAGRLATNGLVQGLHNNRRKM